MTIKKGLCNFYLTLPNKRDAKNQALKKKKKKSLVSFIDVGKTFYLIFIVTVVKKKSQNQSKSLKLEENFNAKLKARCQYIIISQAQSRHGDLSFASFSSKFMGENQSNQWHSLSME